MERIFLNDLVKTLVSFLLRDEVEALYGCCKWQASQDGSKESNPDKEV